MRPRIVSAGWWGTILLALVGVWLMVAPIWVGDQRLGASWTVATWNDVIVGAVLLGISVLGLFAQVAFGLRDLADHAALRERPRGRRQRRP